MSSNEKVSNVLGERKEELVTPPLSEKKSPTKDVEKGTDELTETLLMEKHSLTKNMYNNLYLFDVCALLFLLALVLPIETPCLVFVFLIFS